MASPAHDPSCGPVEVARIGCPRGPLSQRSGNQSDGVVSGDLHDRLAGSALGARSVSENQCEAGAPGPGLANLSLNAGALVCRSCVQRERG